MLIFLPTLHYISLPDVTFLLKESGLKSDGRGTIAFV